MSRNHPQRTFGIALAAACCAAALACSAIAPSEADVKPDYGSVTTITVSTPAMAFVAGGQNTATVTIVREGSVLPLTLAATGLPSGVTATFDPPTLSGTVLATKLTLAASLDAAPTTSPVPVQITVSGNNEMLNGTVVALTVFSPGVRVTLAGTGSGTVMSSPGGISCGATCNGSFAAGSSVTLTAAPAAGSAFAGWSGGCSGTSTTCTLTINVPTTNVTATFNSTAAGFTLALGSSTASLPQGGTAQADVTITRANGYAGSVSLTAGGLPTGLTVTANPAGTTGNTVTLSIAAAAFVGAGSYPIVVSGSGAGINAAQTAALRIEVTLSTSGTGNLAMSWASCDPSEVPLWFAAQTGSGAWTRFTPVSGSFTFPMGPTGGVAYTVRAGPDFRTQVIYGSKAELAALASGGPCDGVHARTGTMRLTGSFVSGPTGGAWTAALGGAVAKADIIAPPGASFTLENAPRGPVDLVGLATVPGSNGAPTFARMILRRNVAYASSIPRLDFVGLDSFVPVGAVVGTLFLTNVDAVDQTASEVSLVTANGATGPYFSTEKDPRIGPYPSLPDSLLEPSDMYAVTAYASPGPNGVRFAALMRHRAARDTVPLGPRLVQPTVTTVASTPYARLRAQFTTQGAYASAARLSVGQDTRSIDVTTTTSYLGSTPTSWTLQIPDLTTAGYDPSWAPSGGAVDWSVWGFGGRFLPFLGGSPQDGAIMVGAAVSNSITAVPPLR